MIKLNLSQKIVVMLVLALAIALSCQKSDGEKTMTATAELDKEATFVPYDTPPTPVGGFAAIQTKLDYPESARTQGIEGKVIVHVNIDEDGTVAAAKIIESLNPSCDEAAISALKSVAWTPAQQDGKPVAVWVAVPVVFKLKEDNPSVPKFVEYDKPPTPKGGFEAIQKHLKYPEIARKAGIEGTVMVELLIDENGNIGYTKILESLGSDNGCDEAAIHALKSCIWLPAQKDGKSVAVSIKVPVQFKLD
jgi:TonB family protein